MLKRLLICNIFLPSLALASFLTPQSDLSSYDGQTIEIRGFFYKNQNKYILSTMPNIKSCCLHSKPYLRIFTEEELPENRAINLQGELHITPSERELHNVKMMNAHEI